MQYCKCHETMSLKQAVTALKDELVELIEEPSMDELSDVVYCLNRLAGTLVNKPYVRVIPGDKLHVAKIQIRMAENGCIRSTRLIIKHGGCPSR